MILFNDASVTATGAPPVEFHSDPNLIGQLQYEGAHDNFVGEILHE